MPELVIDFQLKPEITFDNACDYLIQMSRTPLVGFNNYSRSTIDFDVSGTKCVSITMFDMTCFVPDETRRVISKITVTQLSTGASLLRYVFPYSDSVVSVVVFPEQFLSWKDPDMSCTVAVLYEDSTSIHRITFIDQSVFCAMTQYDLIRHMIGTTGELLPSFVDTHRDAIRDIARDMCDAAQEMADPGAGVPNVLSGMITHQALPYGIRLEYVDPVFDQRYAEKIGRSIRRSVEYDFSSEKPLEVVSFLTHLYSFLRMVKELQIS